MSYTNSSFTDSNHVNKKNTERTLVDNAIRAKTVLVIDGDTSEKLGIMPLYEALQKAAEAGVNLVQMSPGTNGNPPTCKIMDYGKFKYDESKKQKALLKKQRESQVEEKEMTLKPDTAINDLRIKAKKVMEFLDAGARVRVSIRCRGREATHLNVVMDKFREFIDLIPNSVASPINSPPADGPVKIISFMVGYKEV